MKTDSTGGIVRDIAKDRPFFDPTVYGMGPDDFVTDATEGSAVTFHHMDLGGRTLKYVATAGHLVIVDQKSAKPTAKIFFVAFTIEGVKPEARALTFFYNGGPASSSVYVLLGSFAPMRIRTALPGFTPPPPYTIELNSDTLLPRTDMVFINPVGTGLSAAIFPNHNKDFWGVDQDAASFRQFIKRYLTVNDRWNSPKFLYGESYGTARTAVLSYMLHEDGVDLNGVILQSSLLDYRQTGNPVGLLPTLAADALYHHKGGPKQPSPDLSTYLESICQFASTDYREALKQFPILSGTVLSELSFYTGIGEAMLKSWSLDVGIATDNGSLRFLVTLLADANLALSFYDGRVTGFDAGIAANIDPMSGGNDSAMSAVNGAYTVMWNVYLNDDLRFTSQSPFIDLNKDAFLSWDASHIDPSGAETGVDSNGDPILYTAGDLAATMSLNPDLKILSLSGYYDAVTPFYQTTMDISALPVAAPLMKNVTLKNYRSGHLVYLDGTSRTAMKSDIDRFLTSAISDYAAISRILALRNR